MGSLRRLRDTVAHLRFLAWALRLRARLRWHGARLELDAPHGARFTTPPRFRIEPRGDGAATLRLRLGADVDLGRDVTLDVWAGGTNELVLEDGAYLMANVRLQLRGGRIRLGPRSHLRDSVVVKSAGEVWIGDDVTVSWGTVVHCDGRVRLGDRSSVAEHVSFVDSDHAADGSERF